LAAPQIQLLVLVLRCQSSKQVQVQHSLVVRQQGAKSSPRNVAAGEVCLI
jgi:hypothetical protein